MNDSNKDLLDSFVKPLYCPCCSTVSWLDCSSYKLHELLIFKPPYRHYICSLCTTVWYFLEMKENSKPCRAATPF